jgi:hypothetical protein
MALPAGEMNIRPETLYKYWATLGMRRFYDLISAIIKPVAPNWSNLGQSRTNSIARLSASDSWKHCL